MALRVLRKASLRLREGKKGDIHDTEITGYFALLPPEIHLEILQYLAVEPFFLCRLCCTCKAFKILAESDELWSQIIAKKPPMATMVEQLTPPPNVGIKKFYQRYFNVNSGEYRIVVVGAGGAGKSAVTVRFIQGKFVMKYDPTIEDSYRKQVMIGGARCIIDIMDTAGAEEYSALRDSYLRMGQGFVLVYSIISRLSFEYINKVKNSILRIKESQPYVPMVLVGNKADLECHRTVSKAEGMAYAKKNNMGFVETSAWNGTLIDEIFIDLTRYISTTRPLPQKQRKKLKELLPSFKRN